METPRLIIDQAMQWLGTPYLHQGRSRVGCDCVGLIYGVTQELGLLPSDFVDHPYDREPDPEYLIGHLEKHCQRIALSGLFGKELLQPGDIIVFRIRTHPRHLAFYDPQPEYDFLIHALSEIDGTGEVSRHILDDQFWWPRRVAAYRIKEN